MRPAREEADTIVSSIEGDLLKSYDQPIPVSMSKIWVDEISDSLALREAEVRTEMVEKMVMAVNSAEATQTYDQEDEAVSYVCELIITSCKQLLVEKPR